MAEAGVLHALAFGKFISAGLTVERLSFGPLAMAVVAGAVVVAAVVVAVVVAAIKMNRQPKQFS